MELNKDKFELISFNIQTDNCNLKVLKTLPFFNELTMYATSNEVTISPSLHVKDLGITIDNQLNWNQHIFNISKKAKQISGWILSVFYSRNKVPMLILFKSLIRSRLEYCCEVWNPHQTQYINQIENIQRSFTFKIDGMRDFNYWERLERLGIRSLQRRREKLVILHVWKVLHHVYPNTINLTFREHQRSGAIKAILKPLPRLQGKSLTTFEESFAVRSAKLWNCLPPNISKISTLQTFKTKLSNFLKLIPDTPPIPGYPYLNNNSLIHQCLCLKSN